MATTGEQLSKWCLKNKVDGFKGVFCADNLPAVFRPKDMCIIINHSPCDSPSGGSHWLACRVQGDRAYWFDSYGSPPHSTLENQFMGAPGDPVPQFTKWLKKSGVKHVEYNHTDLQSIYSEVCGLYACYFCKHGLPMFNPTAWSFLTNNVDANDEAIKKLVKV